MKSHGRGTYGNELENLDQVESHNHYTIAAGMILKGMECNK